MTAKASAKRAIDNESEQVPKRLKADASRSKGNVSQLRRENEFLRLLEDMHGIGNTSSKEFLDGHIAVIESMTAVGEPTSGPPGIRADKRTMDTTLDIMENKGKIKILKTALDIPHAARRHVRIIYLPTVTPEQLDTYLVNLVRSSVSTPKAPTPLKDKPRGRSKKQQPPEDRADIDEHQAQKIAKAKKMAEDKRLLAENA